MQRDPTSGSAGLQPSDIETLRIGALARRAAERQKNVTPGVGPGN